ncbi:hypothetical protein L916_00623 [Phytophthora nicotianae]|uniref:PiggyBac transposable element-derived protein domain-containing protein n=1 Tax=Phytophthora nicotianae TaxID=4792 RepID=W2JUL6_PHYNI|nr:hypothetical protein L916_00623 [Phytophthora nicotianae]
MELWRELYKQGWTPKPSTGLSNDHRYVRPGRSVRGKDGVDFFTGENALMAFAKQCGWLYYGVTAGSTLHSSSMTPTATSGGVSVSDTTTVMTTDAPSASATPINARNPTAQAVVPSPPVTSATAQAKAPPTLVMLYTAQRQYVNVSIEEEEKTGDQVDYEAEFNMYDSDRFMSALAKNEWSCEAEDDDPNPCSAEVEIDEADEVETEDHLDEVMNVELEEEGERSDFIGDDELKAIADAWVVYDQDHSDEFQVDGASDVYSGRWGPTQSLERTLNRRLVCSTTSCPKATARAPAAVASQPPKQPRPGASDIKRMLTKARPVQVHEMVYFIALLIARVLCPHRRSMGEHWSTTECGAIPRGTFGKYMSRKRFEDITRFLHFNDNSNNRRRKAKAWKLRPVLKIIEKTFRNGHRMGSTLSFDEGMIGSRY